LFKIIHKIVKSFKKLGLGTPPLKKREENKKNFLCVTGCLFGWSTGDILPSEVTRDMRELFSYVFLFFLWFVTVL